METAQDILFQHGLAKFSAFLKQSDEIENIDLPRGEYDLALGCVYNPQPEDPDHIYSYAEDHVWALGYVVKNCKRLPTVHDLLEIHRRLMKNSRLPSHAIGSFRRVQVYVGGSPGANPVAVPYKIDDLCSRLARESAISAHRQFEIIHPFLDGNGRSGRLFWLWLRLYRGETIGPFLETAGYPGETFQAKRIAYYQDLQAFRFPSMYSAI
jgi:Fic family protein